MLVLNEKIIVRKVLTLTNSTCLIKSVLPNPTFLMTISVYRSFNYIGQVILFANWGSFE